MINRVILSKKGVVRLLILLIINIRKIRHIQRIVHGISHVEKAGLLFLERIQHILVLKLVFHANAIDPIAPGFQRTCEQIIVSIFRRHFETILFLLWAVLRLLHAI